MFRHVHHLILLTHDEHVETPCLEPICGKGGLLGDTKREQFSMYPEPAPTPFLRQTDLYERIRGPVMFFSWSRTLDILRIPAGWPVSCPNMGSRHMCRVPSLQTAPHDWLPIPAPFQYSQMLIQWIVDELRSLCINCFMQMQTHDKRCTYTRALR